MSIKNELEKARAQLQAEEKEQDQETQALLLQRVSELDQRVEKALKPYLEILTLLRVEETFKELRDELDLEHGRRISDGKVVVAEPEIIWVCDICDTAEWVSEVACSFFPDAFWLIDKDGKGVVSKGFGGMEMIKETPHPKKTAERIKSSLKAKISIELVTVAMQWDGEMRYIGDSGDFYGGVSYWYRCKAIPVTLSREEGKWQLRIGENPILEKAMLNPEDPEIRDGVRSAILKEFVRIQDNDYFNGPLSRLGKWGDYREIITGEPGRRATDGYIKPLWVS